MKKDVTGLLARWGDGDKDALNELMPLVYDELRRLAGGHLRREGHQHSLQPTLLVNEAYLRLIQQQKVSFQNRTQFFGLAAQVIRHILVDYARQHRAAKRGGGEYKLSLTEADRLQPQQDVDLVMLDDALKSLAQTNPRHSRIVDLRFFGGLTNEETATVLGVSLSTVEREWSFARAWLRRELRR